MFLLFNSQSLKTDFTIEETPQGNLKVVDNYMQKLNINHVYQ